MAAVRVLLVDLNNFARYPTLSIGYLVAALRADGAEVEVLMPLNLGVPAVERERQESLRDQMVRRAYFSSHPAAVAVHDVARSWASRQVHQPDRRVLDDVFLRLAESPPDALLLSAYVDHYPTVRRLGELAAAAKVPVLVGGPGFNDEGVAESWRRLPGLSALVGAEVDLSLAKLVRAVVDGADLLAFPGVVLPDGRRSPAAPPLAPLDRLPVPDFSDFPWSRYPSRVVPIMTGRGCEWARCTFCSDVVTTNGRTFRSRPVRRVLDELEEQTRRHDARDVIFLDIKLNSSLEMWHALLDGFQRRVPGGRWIGTVHVGERGDNGLSRDELRAAYASGMRRITFGLETGSQRMNNAMAKGTRLDSTARFLADAHDAGLSVRTTMMLGYPGETTQDVRLTARFLEEHGSRLDRVRMSSFKAVPGTRFAESYDRAPDHYPGVEGFTWDRRFSRATYSYAPAKARDYRRAKSAVLGHVHAINRRPLRPGAESFDGLM